MSKRIIEVAPHFTELTLAEMADRIHKEHGLRAELFYSMYHKKWQVNNYFVNFKKGKKVEPKGNVSARFDDYFDALELAIFELLKVI